jgi:hypothetical protein
MVESDPIPGRRLTFDEYLSVLGVTVVGCTSVEYYSNKKAAYQFVVTPDFQIFVGTVPHRNLVPAVKRDQANLFEGSVLSEEDADGPSRHIYFRTQPRETPEMRVSTLRHAIASKLLAEEP